MVSESGSSAAVISQQALLDHWQGHRRLTRRVIEAFPEDQLFHFSVGGMRPFGALAMEMLGMAAPMVRGVVTGEWKEYTAKTAVSRDEILSLWDEATEEINSYWSQIPLEAFHLYLHPSLAKLALISANVAIVAYLARLLLRTKNHQDGSAARG